MLHIWRENRLFIDFPIKINGLRRKSLINSKLFDFSIKVNKLRTNRGIESKIIAKTEQSHCGAGFPRERFQQLGERRESGAHELSRPVDMQG